MLVLSRKQDQKIVIGENITITVLQTRGNTVRLGIDAPRDIKVVRGELEPRDTTEQQGRNAAAPADDSAEPDAQFTVVFSNTRDDAEKRARPAKPAGVQCERQAAAADAKDGDQPALIRFQGQLPKTMQRNRLKEIVDRIANEPK